MCAQEPRWLVLFAARRCAVLLIIHGEWSDDAGTSLPGGVVTLGLTPRQADNQATYSSTLRHQGSSSGSRSTPAI
jgi:hypothetical protein